MLLNRCVTRATSTTDAREALQDLGYDVLGTAVPRLEVYAQSFGMPIPGNGRQIWRNVAQIDRAVRRCARFAHELSARAAEGPDGRRCSEAQRARSPPGRADRDPVQAGPDHPGPEPGTVPGAHSVGGLGRGHARPPVGLADAMRAMIRVTTENPDEVLDRLRRDRAR